MKAIFNYKRATVADLESDGLLDEATKLHVLSFQMEGKDIKSFHGTNEIERIKSFFQWHLDNEVPVVMHNGIGFDIPLMEKLTGMDLSNIMLIDTLALSWYLNPERKQHGLASFFEDYGFEKPPIDDWHGLTYEEYEFRCVGDIKINTALWKDLISRLESMYALAKDQIDQGNVGGQRVSKKEVMYIDSLKGLSVEEHVNRILTFLMFKMDCARLQEKTMWEVDVGYLRGQEEKLLELVETATTELKGVMPVVPIYAKRKEPSKPFKKNGDLSTAGQKWEILKKMLVDGTVDEHGFPLAKVITQGEIHELTGYNEPNPGSVSQLKDFLFSKGWVPETFAYKRDEKVFQEWIDSKPEKGSFRGAWTIWKNSKPEDREIPQITKEGEDGKELCPSILELAETVPEVKALENYSMIKHRLGMIQGFLENLVDGKYLQARINGFTNTLRVKHAGVVNLPAANKPFAEAIRGCLIAGKGRISIGSDLSGIEDRTKHGFMIPYDPDYVKNMMADDYDPHLATAVASGMLSQEDADGYKRKEFDEEKMTRIKVIRALAKTVNYSSVYGVGADKLSRTAKVSKKDAEDALEGYWKLNWSVKAIAEDQVVVVDERGSKWLINPINGHMYSLRSEKDIFSTLNQGTGSYYFDMWVDEILTRMQEKWGRKTLTASFHDEVVIIVKDNEKFKKEMEEIIYASIDAVSEKFLVRRGLGCECQFGYRYSEIH